MKKIYGSLFLAFLLGSTVVSTVAFADEKVAAEEEDEDEEVKKKAAEAGHAH
ncbi:MAG: hypothetical protein ACRC12_03095 [Holosporales bacterium]